MNSQSVSEKQHLGILFRESHGYASNAMLTLGLNAIRKSCQHEKLEEEKPVLSSISPSPLTEWMRFYSSKVGDDAMHLPNWLDIAFPTHSQYLVVYVVAFRSSLLFVQIT